MQHLADIMPKVLANPSGQGLQSPSRTSNSVTLIDHPEGRLELSEFLFQCFDALKVYGKEPDQMKHVNSMFQLVLADYPIDKIRSAFTYYLKFNSDLPAPADIATIIERGNKPPFDRAVYVAISKKQAEDRTSDEWKYMRDYEHFIVTGKN